MGRGAFLEHLRMGVTVQSTFMDGFEWVDVTVQKAFLKTFHFAADLVTFTEEILNGKLHFLCSDPILYNFLLVFQQAELAVMDLSIFPTIYQCFHCLQMADLIFKSRVLVFFVEILSFGFCIVNSECDAYLAVYNSLFYSCPKIFLLF